jgi:acyl-coenzyme A synthetase/AMP-(fatty) acid ligase
MFSRYWGDPVRTEQALDHGWYASGDAVRVSDDGSVAVLGRADDVWTDHSGNVRSASELLDEFSRIFDVEEVVVFSPSKSARNRPTVICRLSSSADGLESVKEETAKLTRRLSLNVDVYHVPDWPKTPVGKPDRQALLAWAAAG